MYHYIIGIVTKIKDNSIILENNGIGYIIYVAKPKDYQENTSVKIYLYHLIKETEQTFYGFSTEYELNIFTKLLNVKGLGTKMAISILGYGPLEKLEKAFEEENIVYFKNIPKIGDRLATQILMEFKKDKKNIKKINNETIESLLALGYKRTEIIKVINNIDLSKNVENQIKDALKLLSNQ